MNDPDNFLKRWSRRKHEAVLQPKDPGTAPAQAGEAEQKPETVAPQSIASATPEFDVNSLPPIESIGADTDISAFMQKGVPSALRHAALRRAWAADPAIRDFMGPTENYWDAAGPDGIPGFGDLDPSLDVKRLVSELFGETAPDKPATEKPASVGASDQSDQISEASPSHEKLAHPPTENEGSRRTDDVAVQKQSPPSGPPQRMTRRHGGAMPE